MTPACIFCGQPMAHCTTADGLDWWTCAEDLYATWTERQHP